LNCRIARDRYTFDQSDLVSEREQLQLTRGSGNFVRSNGRGSDDTGQSRNEVRRNGGALIDGRSRRGEAADQCGGARRCCHKTRGSESTRCESLCRSRRVWHSDVLCICLNVG
jgi:hypothetical protein